MSKSLSLYPRLEPYSTGFLSAGKHKIYYEECGNPKGKPAVFVHGGPGGGGSKQARRFFNPESYRIIIFDQRGCGRSKPHGCLDNNTTWDLVDDMEKLKTKLNISKWLVFGGSWGSTLSLAYAQTYPESVSELVLRGIFMLREKELDWFYQCGASKIFPEAWDKFLEPIHEDNRDNLVSAYHNIFLGRDEKKKQEAAIAWSAWEASTSKLNYDPEMVASFSEPRFALAFALIENHYFINKGFFDNEDQLINQIAIDKIKHIPTKIIQGRYDMVCPIETAWELSKNWLEAELIIGSFSGHSAFEKEIVHHLISTTNEFSQCS